MHGRERDRFCGREDHARNTRIDQQRSTHEPECRLSRLVLRGQLQRVMAEAGSQGSERLEGAELLCPAEPPRLHDALRRGTEPEGCCEHRLRG